MPGSYAAPGAVTRSDRPPRAVMLLLVDLDGVVYRGPEPVPGVAAVLADRAARGDDVVYVTNNSMYYRTDYVTRLAAMGAPVSPQSVVVELRACHGAVPARARPGRPARPGPSAQAGWNGSCAMSAYEVVTAASAATRVAQEGIDGFAAAGRPDAVVVGLDPEPDLRAPGRGRRLRSGPVRVSSPRTATRPTRPSAACARAPARSSPPSRSRPAVVPVSIGKPAPYLLEEAAHAVGREPARGDHDRRRLSRTSPPPAPSGARCVLMLTGVTTGPTRRARSPPTSAPTSIAADADGAGRDPRGARGRRSLR